MMDLITLIALVVATVIPLAVLGFIRSRNLYQTGEFRLVLTSFLWGILIYAIVAAFNSQVLLGMGVVDSATLVKFITPWQEEILKALLFIYLLRQINFTYFVDGAIYGFAIGIGFAIVENYEYILAYQDAALGVAISRVISTNLIHAAATAMVGIAFGRTRILKKSSGIWNVMAGFILAIGLHLGFNNLVNEVNSSFLLLYAAASGIVATGFIYWAIRNGLSQAKGWIHEKLGKADRVTLSESQLVQNIDSAKELLAPLTEVFGKSQADQIQKFLLIQARLGLHRKNLDNYQDAAMIASTQAEITALQIEMDALRRDVGPYSMAMIRSIFPEEENALWLQLTDTIEQRMKDPTHARGGLWEKLGSVSKKPESPTQNLGGTIHKRCMVS